MKKMVIFGDSLSDNDNLKRWLKIMPEYPYWFGRFTSGLTWSEYLAKDSGLASFNWAVGGAKSAKTKDITAAEIIKYVKAGGRNFVTGSMSTSIDRYLGRWLTNGKTINAAAAKETVYVLWIGANDYLEKFDDQEDFNRLLDQPNKTGGYQLVSTRAVDNIIENIIKLNDKGAINFVVPNLPDVGYTPTMATTKNYDFSKGRIKNRTELSAAVTVMVQTHNKKLADALQKLQVARQGKLNILPVNIFSDFDQLIRGKNPFTGGDFDAQFNNQYYDVIAGDSGLKIPKKCFTGGYVALGSGVTNKEWRDYASKNTCKNTDQSFNSFSTYWDDVHPTSYSHCLLSYTFYYRMHEAGLLKQPPKPLEEHRSYCQQVVPK